MKNPCIAFKLNYCDGGQDEDHFGFYGICSDAVINHNITKVKRAWCSNARCPCKQYFDEKISPEKLESQWKEKGGEENHLCVLTTVRPNMPEYDRIIFAIFIMHEIFSGNDEEPGFVRADDYRRLEFRPREVHKIKFWDVYQNPKSPQKKSWRSGLFRYFDDTTAVKFLERAVEVKRGTPEEDFAKEFLKQYPYK